MSMQGVAESLDLTKMSLYRYVAGKSELVAVMIELAVGDPPQLGRVRGGLVAPARALGPPHVSDLDEHPWLPWVMVGDPGHRSTRGGLGRGPRSPPWTTPRLHPINAWMW